ncbi:creatininase family protein [Rhizobiales bacterium TNE-4]|nr:creatininase family protein [Rhizobiales bacterium TNE-4]MBV1827700.1 creatininase family protein [Rhizobiales bacterium TNE-4]
MQDDVLWARSTAESLRRRAAEGAVVILPVASTEQHGPHLATGVDTILCGEVCRRAAHLTKGPTVVAPTLWVGLAEHHMEFGGSFTLTLPTYKTVIEEICRSIMRAGFKHIVICNGHGGNISALNAMSADLARSLGQSVGIGTYWLLDPDAIAAALEDQTTVLHACEAETSMMLALAPELADPARFHEANGGETSPTNSATRILSPAFQVWRGFKAMTATGVIGDAAKASAEKGERLLDASARALARCVDGFAGH